MKPLQLIFTGIFITFIAIAAAIAVRGQSRYDNQFDAFWNAEILGNIIGLRDLGRGSSEFRVARNQINDTLIFNCNCAFDVEKYTIKIGDSVSKSPKSSVLTIYQGSTGKGRIITLRVE